MEESFAGRRVTVMGLGTFGAGLAAVRFFAQQGATVTVTDLRPEAQLADSLAELRDCHSLTLRLGTHDERDFIETDLVVVSPSVKPGNRYVELPAAHGIAVTSEIRLFWQRCPAPIIGVTGSNGKSTTATLIHDVLRADGRRVWLGGNIGRSLLTCADQIRETDWVVLELSSFQLHDLDRDRRSPHVGVVTNFTPNHLDWHGSMEDYASSKQTLFRWQNANDVAVRRRSSIEADWPTAARSIWCGRGAEGEADVRLDESGRTLHFSGDDAVVDLNACPGLSAPHLRSAALLAATVGYVLEIPVPTIVTALGAFTGLPHRLQHVGSYNGVSFINDSASTTPESTIAALAAIQQPLTLIVGGAEKGSDLDELAAAIVRRAGRVIAIGDVREKLVDAVNRQLASHTARLSRNNSDQTLRPESISTAQTLDTAVETACRQSSAGDIILFSPGFASGSMFRNFDDRGRIFSQLARRSMP